MSLRAIASRLFRHGQCYFRHAGVPKRDIHTSNIGERVNAARQVQQAQLVPRSFALRSVGLQVGLHARRILVDNVLNRVTSSLAAKLRKEAAKRMLFGDSGHFFALVGVSLASGAGILTKEEELEGVCWEIREAVSKIKWHYQNTEVIVNSEEAIGVKNLDFGSVLGKGANAVVYTARLLQNEPETIETTSQHQENNSEITEIVSEGHFGSVPTTQPATQEVTYPLAVKMMFNYDIQSNGMAILRAMYKETIPARVYYSNVGITDWELALSNGKKHLPPHPNIVAMYSVFTDFVPELQDATNLYPAALPQRIHSEGEGRNMSLFLIMKKYECSLQEYLSSSSPITIRQSILLFTQLLEGVAHLCAHGIAHRDLKADNLLLDMSEEDAPILVISDFGCCLADKNQHLTVNYNSYEVDKGGNTALMAPEIINQTPGTFSLLNYNKSDLWAAATIAYEIFGMNNPFYDGLNGKLRAGNYQEDELPRLGGEDNEIPDVFHALVANLLKRNPNRRLDAEVAANVCQLYLWAPSAWLKPMVKLPTSNEILQWLLCLTTKVLCEGRLSNPQTDTERSEYPTYDTGRTQFETTSNSSYYSKGRRTYTEYLLISSFLVRAKLANVKAALQWIQNNIF